MKNFIRWNLCSRLDERLKAGFKPGASGFGCGCSTYYAKTIGVAPQVTDQDKR